MIANGAWRAAGSRVAACVLGLALLAAAGVAQALTWDAERQGEQPIPPLSAHVTDLTGTLSSSDRQALEAKLADWEARTTNQLAVLIVPSTKPETIEEYSIRVAEAWKVGQKGKDNGVVFLIAKNDKQMRIEVGYGLEGDLTDVASRRIIGDTVAPLFSQGKFAEGINAGVDRIMAVVGGTDTAATATQPPRRPRGAHGFDFGTIALIALVVVPALGAVLRSVLGNVGGSVAGGAIVGAVTWLIAGSILFGVVAAVIALIVIAFSSFGGGRGPGMWFPGGGWGGGGWGGGGGGGWSGGGGTFGGGGASGGWR